MKFSLSRYKRIREVVTPVVMNLWEKKSRRLPAASGGPSPGVRPKKEKK